MPKQKNNNAERKEQAKRLRKAKVAVVGVLTASLAVFVVIAALAVINEGTSKFVGTLLSLNPYYYLLALACVLLGDIIGFPKWDLFLKKLKIKLPKSKNFLIYLSMFSMDITPGRWGRAAVAYTVNRQTGTTFGQTFPAVVADIFTDFLGFIVVALVTAFMVHRYSSISIVISILLLIPFVFIFYEKPFKYLKKKFYKYRQLRSFFNIGDTYFQSKRLLSFGSYAFAMLFTVPAMIFSGLALYFVILSFGIHMSAYFIPTLLFIYTSALLLGMVTGIPGTLGITDAALLGYLVAFFPGLGITFGVAALITIFFRVASIWFEELISSAVLLYTTRYWKTKA
ncbi:MAG: lysylphosphatidylglycerol synthase transmembrane domain-containing protein [Candidatus Micrarchaeia archaeon]